MKYSLNETIGFAESINKKEALVDLNQLIAQEGCEEIMPVFINNEVVLDMDLVEKKTAKTESRTLNKSMDSAFIITNNEDTKVLFVEFRFNYEKMRGLNRNALIEKVSGSIAVLNNNPNIHNQYYFIFKSNLKYQAIRRFRNMNPSIPNNFIATDITDLKATFF
jgi:hypothetical protein